MNRREFLKRSAWITAGGLLIASSPALAQKAAQAGTLRFDADLYKLFRNPELKYRPYFRWWWPGGRVQAEELVRQLRMLKGVGIGGVEINTIQFPRNADDMGIPSLPFLSDGWIDMVKVAFEETKRLGLTCDMIVGSGFPFGGEFLAKEDRAQLVGIGVKKLKGPLKYKTSLMNLLLEADPKSGHLYAGRTVELLSIKRVPDPMNSIDQAVDLTPLAKDELFTIDIPEGNHAIYVLIRIESFAGVIQGAPGAQGPILNHLNASSVERYLNHMSDTIEARIGPMKEYVRSFFCDSMELAGHNWADDMAEQFRLRRGYDLMPYLPYILYEIGSFGNVLRYDYGVKMSPEFEDVVNRVRYDFELTKAELFLERFTQTFTRWANKLGIQSRAQGYGRGFFPLETSMHLDIPEAESWSTNWLQHRIGEEMGYEDYRRGRSYTMVNKFVTSGAHLAGKRWISCEEMTNTYRVFNVTMEFNKVGTDMNSMAGITHSIWHGFNYSPPDAPFPGWIVYGGFYSERNNWWPYFHYLNDYRARLSSVFTNAEMYGDIAIMPPVADMWTTIGMQQEPFPSTLNVTYYSYIWEALNKHGNGSDYVSDSIIRGATIKNGRLNYGPRSYKTLFLPAVERMDPETLARIYEFAQAGGRVICIDKMPHMSLGLHNSSARDAEVKAWVDKLKALPTFTLEERPEGDNFMAWTPGIQRKYDLAPYLTFSEPNLFLLQNRFRTDAGSEIIFIANTHLHLAHRTRVTFGPELTRGRYAWLWDPHTGEKYRLELKNGGIDLDLGPAESMLVVFNKDASQGKVWAPVPVSAPQMQILGPWQVELQNSITGETIHTEMDDLKDLKETDYVSFTGTAIYRTTVNVDSPDKDALINLGKVFGVSDLRVNGHECGITWYGRRIYRVGEYLRAGRNEIEVRVTTTMGNHIQMEMKDNKAGQQLTNRPGRPQPVQSMGLAGPVTLY